MDWNFNNPTGLESCRLHEMPCDSNRSFRSISAPHTRVHERIYERRSRVQVLHLVPWLVSPGIILDLALQIISAQPPLEWPPKRHKGTHSRAKGLSPAQTLGVKYTLTGPFCHRMYTSLLSYHSCKFSVARISKFQISLARISRISALAKLKEHLSAAFTT